MTYTVTVYAVSDPVDSDWEPTDLDLPPNASVEVAMSHIQDRILADPLEFVAVPTKLWICVERDGDSCHSSMSIAYEEEE